MNVFKKEHSRLVYAVRNENSPYTIVAAYDDVLVAKEVAKELNYNFKNVMYTVIAIPVFYDGTF